MGCRASSTSDKGDAKMLADLVRTDRHNHRRVAGDTEQAEAVRILARGHQNLIWTRTRLRSPATEIQAGLRAGQLAAPDAVADAFAATTIASVGIASVGIASVGIASVGIITELNRQIVQLEASLTASLEQHPDTDIDHSLPGFGVVLGTRALGESETIRTALPAPSFAGTTPAHHH